MIDGIWQLTIGTGNDKKEILENPDSAICKDIDRCDDNEELWFFVSIHW